jgi:hypothetical protein
MLVEDFRQNCTQYDKFEIWDVENMNAFFKGNKVLIEIFETDFKMSVEEFKEKRAEIEHSDMDIMKCLLDQIGDKHFFIFTLHSKEHLELVQLQRQKTMDFGMNIEDIREDHVYIIIMDKKAEITYIN